MDGWQLTADLHGCSGAAVRGDAATLRTLALAAVRAAGLSPVGELFHAFGPDAGVTGVVLLAESHLALHTWPELGAATLDVYVCNLSADNGPRAEALLAALEAAFAPARSERQRLRRGALAHAPDVAPDVAAGVALGIAPGVAPGVTPGVTPGIAPA